MLVRLPETVVVLGPDAPDIVPHLSVAIPSLCVQAGGPEPDTPYALIGFSPDDLSTYPNAGWVHISGAGANGMLAALAVAAIEPALITRTVGQMGQQIGEYVLSYILADAQKHTVRRHLQATRNWDVASGTPRRISGQTALILGTGGIGQGIAKVLRAVGIRCLGASRSGRMQEVFESVIALDDLGPQPDIDCVIGALPLTKETEKRIDKRVFETLEGALFINVGRGATADIEALKRALATGQVRHAVLDVVPQEPLPPGSDLWDWPGVSITPHVSGLTLPEDSAEAFVAAYRALEDGREPNLVVNPDAGY